MFCDSNIQCRCTALAATMTANMGCVSDLAPCVTSTPTVTIAWFTDVCGGLGLDLQSNIAEDN